MASAIHMSTKSTQGQRPRLASRVLVLASAHPPGFGFGFGPPPGFRFWLRPARRLLVWVPVCSTTPASGSVTAYTPTLGQGYGPAASSGAGDSIPAPKNLQNPGDWRGGREFARGRALGRGGAKILGLRPGICEGAAKKALARVSVLVRGRNLSSGQSSG